MELWAPPADNCQKVLAVDIKKRRDVDWNVVRWRRQNQQVESWLTERVKKNVCEGENSGKALSLVPSEVTSNVLFREKEGQGLTAQFVFAAHGNWNIILESLIKKIEKI